MNNIKYVGRNGISSEVVAHSISPEGKEIVTVKVKYGLIVHAEFLRHRQLSRGVKSNRAIPCATIRKEVLKDPYIPLFFGKNKKGMQADEEMKFAGAARWLFKTARYPVVAMHWLLDKMGLHKQVCNRLLNPWQFVEETITGTEWKNLYALRIHEAAQEDIKEVVNLIHLSITESQAKGNVEYLQPGEWHTPYVEHFRKGGVLYYVDNDGERLSVEQALQASAARCARSSYNRHDGSCTTYKQDAPLFEVLLKDSPKHASPVEHQATPMQKPLADMQKQRFVNLTGHYEKGITHISTDQKKMWSGNFQGWIQHRQLIKDHVVEG